MSSEDELNKIFGVAEDVALKAGKIVKEGISQKKSIDTKAGFADLVTETDQKVEKFIISSFKTAFPSHKFIGEESVAAGKQCVLTDDPTWIIDPVDGTTNFVHTLPYIGVSIALLVGKQAKIGIVYNPIADDFYYARAGHGSFHNKERIHCSKTDELHQALVFAEFGSGRESDRLDAKVRNMRQVIAQVHGIRCMGSAALNMCGVARGLGDAYFEFGIHCWDIAAAMLIVKEAGGVVLDCNGGPIDLMARQVLCGSTQKLISQLVPLLETVPYERD